MKNSNNSKIYTDINPLIITHFAQQTWIWMFITTRKLDDRKTNPSFSIGSGGRYFGRSVTKYTGWYKNFSQQ